MRESGSTDQEGGQGGIPIGGEFGVSQAARTAKSQVNNGVLRWKIRWPYIKPRLFSFSCLWV